MHLTRTRRKIGTRRVRKMEREGAALSTNISTKKRRKIETKKKNEASIDTRYLINTLCRLTFFL